MVKARTYHHDDTDRITDIEDDTDPDNPKTITYGYDKNGNMTSKSDSSMPTEDMSFVYNSADQLVQAIRGPPESGTVLGLYDYNHAGLRVRHRFSERGDVDYYYDENAVIEERNADDGSLLAFYRYADRLISLDTGAGKQYYHHDALGSTVNLTDESGGVRVSYVLDPWGHIREQVGESVNRQIFTGQEHDERTGLIYFDSRYYDPDIARFVTQDAYLGEIGTPPSLHRYLYAYSNPTVYIDLYGYEAWSLIQPTVHSETDIFGPTPVRDTGSQFLDELWAGTDIALSFPKYLINAGFGILSSPAILYSEASGVPVAQADMEIVGRLASTGQLAPYLMSGCLPFRIGPVLSQSARLSRALGESVAEASRRVVPKITAELGSGIADTGRRIMHGEIGGRLNPFNYKVEGIGSLGGNPKYRPRTTKMNPAHYKTDSLGRTTHAEGIITGPHKGRGKGYRPEPAGGRVNGEHRGHLIPEGGVDDPKAVNVRENIISESPRSNLGPKKKFDNMASEIARENPGSVVRTIHEPHYSGNDMRPHAVTHTITVDGNEVHSVTIPNQ